MCLSKSTLLVILLNALSLVLGYLPQSQIDALVDIYDTLHGDLAWTCKWNLTKLFINDTLDRSDFCYLIIFKTITDTLDDNDPGLQTVTKMKFDGNQLLGTFPVSAFTQLTDLEFLWIWDEPFLRGSFPNLCSMSKLQKLVIGRTNLTGTIPHCMGNMTSVRDLRMYGADDYNSDVNVLIFDDVIIEM